MTITSTQHFRNCPQVIISIFTISLHPLFLPLIARPDRRLLMFSLPPSEVRDNCPLTAQPAQVEGATYFFLAGKVLPGTALLRFLLRQQQHVILPGRDRPHIRRHVSTRTRVYTTRHDHVIVMSFYFLM